MRAPADAEHLLSVLSELHSAARAFRDAAYDAGPTLVVSDDPVSRLSTALFMAGKVIASHGHDLREREERRTYDPST